MISTTGPSTFRMLRPASSPAGDTTNPAPGNPPGTPPPPDKPQPPPPGPAPAKPSGAQPADGSTPNPPSTPPSSPSSGGFDPQQTTSITRTFDRPVLDRTRLGSIPQDYYQWTWGWGYPYGSSTSHPVGGGSNDFGPVQVYRDVPEVNPDGTPKMRSVTETVTGSTYNQKTRTLVGGLLAAGAGVGGAALTASLMGSAAGPVGMIVGGVLGAAAGAAIGMKTAAGDKLKEAWVAEGISTPRFTGYTEWLQPSYHTEEECHTRWENGHEVRECIPRQVLDGFWHQFSPEIAWTQIGSFQYPALEHTAKVGTAGGLALAAGAGALVGVGALLIASIL